MGDEKKKIKEQILEAIKTRHIAMRPKWQFMLQTTLLITGGVVVFLVLLYLASFILFILRFTGLWFVPAFGFRGWYTFLFSLPWILVLVLAVFVLILEILVRRYAFAYRRPLLYSVSGILVLVLLGGFIVDRTEFHARFAEFSKEHGVPFAGGFYEQFESPPGRNIYGGRVTAVDTTGFTLLGRRGENTVITITPATRFPFGTDLGEGDFVLVFGDPASGTIRAFGVRKVDGTGLPFPPLRRHHLFPQFFNEPQ